MKGNAAAVLGFVGLSVSALAAPAAPAVPRAELEAIQAAVEAAVARVSRPAGLMFGRPSRAYHLKGYGAVVVLAPRALPRVRRHSADAPEALAFAEVLGRLERSIGEVRDPAERRRLEETLVTLRNGLPTRAPLSPPRPRRAERHRDFESLQEQAEAFRREAERAIEKAEREVRVRLREPLPPPEPPLPVVAPVPPVPEAPAAPPAEPAPPAPPAMPGWPFWFGEAEVDDTPPDRVLADVRRAIVAGLGAYRGGLGLLGPDEFVVVAVDFVPRLADRAGARTVVARARRRDLLEHRAGRLSAEGLDARVEFDEY